MNKLTAKQQRFVDEYLIDCNATQAAIRAGYSKKTATQIGEQNLRKLDISVEIEKLKANVSEKCEIIREDNVNRWKDHAFLKATEYMEIDEDGRPKFKPFGQWSERAKNSLQEVQITELSGGLGLAMKAKFYNQQVALKNLGEMNGDYADAKTGKDSRPIEQKNITVNFNTVKIDGGDSNGNGNGLQSKHTSSS